MDTSNEKYEGGYDLVCQYMHGVTEYCLRLTATAETVSSTTYQVGLVEVGEDGNDVRTLGERLIQVPIKPQWSDAQLDDMRAKGIDMSELIMEPELPAHEVRFDYNEGYTFFREWMRELGEPERLATTEVRAVDNLANEVGAALDRAQSVVAELIQRHRETDGDDHDFTPLMEALIQYERSGDALIEEVMRWWKPDAEG